MNCSIAFWERGLHDDFMRKKRTLHEEVGIRVKGVQRSLASRLRTYLVAGVLITAPISITVYLTYIFLKLVDEAVIRMFPNVWYDQFYGDTTIPGLGFLAAVAFFVLVGWLTTNILGRFFVKLAEYFVDRVPVIRTLYGAIKQILETVMASKSQAFREAVMIEYPRKGMWAIGFVTGETKGEAQDLTDKETINVFVPTTPNPTSGFLLFVPKTDVKYLDMSVEEAVKLVVSAGIITPDEKPKKKTIKKKTATKKK